MRKLYEIESDLLAIDEMMSRDQPADEEAAAFAAAFEADLNAETSDKVDAYCALIQNWTALVEQRKEEAKRMRMLAERDEMRADWLRGRLKQFMERTGNRKIECARFTASIQKNGGKAPVEADPLSMGQWPEDCRRVTVEPSKERIRERLEAGEQLVGCAILPRGESLRIK